MKAVEPPASTAVSCGKKYIPLEFRYGVSSVCSAQKQLLLVHVHVQVEFMREVPPKNCLPFVLFISALEKTGKGIWRWSWSQGVVRWLHQKLTYIIKVEMRFPVFSLYTGLDGDWKRGGKKNEALLSAQFYPWKTIKSICTVNSR